MDSIKTGIFVLSIATLGASSALFADGHTQMDPAVMDKMQALMSPGAEHKKLGAFSGKWNCAGMFKMSAEAEPENMKATSEIKVINGGRFLLQTYKGDWMGQPFLGTGYTGYDNVKKTYVSIWLDNMGTGIMTTTGTYEDATKTLSMAGTHSCPMTGETHRQYRSEWKVVDANTHVYTSYALAPDGNEFKGMEITYTRAP